MSKNQEVTNEELVSRIACSFMKEQKGALLEVKDLNNDEDITFLLDILVSNDLTSDDLVKILGYIKSRDILMERLVLHQDLFDDRVIDLLKKFSDEELSSLLEKVKNRSLQVYIVAAMDNVSAKERYMQVLNFKESEMYSVAYCSTDIEHILKIVLRINNEILCSFLVGRIRDLDIVKEFFSKITLDEQKKLIVYLSFNELKLEFLKENYRVLDIKFLEKLINSIKDEELKKKATEVCFDSEKKEQSYMNTIDPIDALPDILGFGVEIEVKGPKSNLILENEGYLFHEYRIKEEKTVNDGVEFISPVLHFRSDDIKSIYEVCNFAINNDFVVDYQCGGHIHFSSKYLDSYFAWYLMYYLYTKLERILFIISNREGATPRMFIENFASPFGKTYVSVLDKINSLKSEEDFIREVQRISGDKTDAINIKNIGVRMDTIEFRMPNGEIDANIIVENVLLFGNLLVLARKLSFLPHSSLVYDLLKKFDETSREEEVLETFLKMAFRSEANREIYRKRYKSNLPLFNLCSSEFEDKFKSFNLGVKG